MLRWISNKSTTGFDEEKGKILSDVRNRKIPINDAGFLSYLFITWITPLVLRITKNNDQTLNEDDVWECSDYETAKYNTERLSAEWTQEFEDKGPQKASFMSVWLCAIRTRLMILIATMCCFAIVGLLSTAFVAELMIHYLLTTDKPLWFGLMTCGVMCVGQIFRCVLLQFLYSYGVQTGLYVRSTAKVIYGREKLRKKEKPGIRMRAGILGLSYQKVLKLKTLQGTDLAEVVTIFGADAQRICMGCTTFIFFISLPMYVIFCAMYLYYLIGLWCLLPLGMYFAFYQFQIWLSSLITHLRIRGLAFTDKRIRKMAEIIESMKFIKMYAWEDPFSKNIKGVHKRRRHIKRIIERINMAFECNECKAKFSKMNLLMQHQRTVGHRNRYACDICHKTFGRVDNLNRHRNRHQDETKYHCDVCGKFFSREDSLLRHQNTHNIQHGGAVSISENQENEPPRKRLKLDLPYKHYDIRVMKETELPKFNTKSIQYKVTFQELEVRDIPEILRTLKRLFQSIIEDITEYMKPTDLVRMSLQSPDLDYPIAMPFMKVKALTAERVLSEIERVLQSYEEFTLDDNLEIDLVHVSLPQGGVGKRCRYIDLDKMMKDKRCFIRIINNDDLCCARAIVTAKARIDNHEKWNSIRTGCKIQEVLAKDLHLLAMVPLMKCGLDEIKRFQNVMQGYQINVLSKEHFNALIFSGPDGGIPLYLYHHDDHYDVITSMPAFLSKNYFCTKCKSGYDRKAEHTCNNSCLLCRHVHDNKENGEEQWIPCEKCNRSFRNATCYQLHFRKTERGNTTCETLYKCGRCSQLVNRRMHSKPQQCGETYCSICKEFVSEDHECFMQRVEVEEREKRDTDKEIPKVFIYFDFECTQETLQECSFGYEPLKLGGKCNNCKRSTCGSYVHEPNLCVVHKVCEKCQEKTIDEYSAYPNCGQKEYIFDGNDTVEKFCKWLFSKQNRGAKVLCHNFKGYDSFPILQYLYENGILPEVITTGTKFLSVDVPQCNIRFLDSLNFLPMALSELPEAFGFSELCKGFFPHLYNRRENWNSHVPGLPDRKFFNPDGMKPQTRKSFLKWYEEHKSDTFAFKDELLKYCKSDVDILRRSCTAFRNMFMHITKRDGNNGIDPFERCITIASACNLVFRALFLKQESIGIIPSHGYRPQHKQSIKAIKWIKYLSEIRHVEITHALNGGEKQIGPYHVDGYYEKDGVKVVLEFHGDFWHGCPKCYSGNTINPVTGTPMSELYQQTQEKRLYLEQLGYTYECIWECEFEKELKLNETMNACINSMNISEPLEPRDAFYGGRTEAFKLYAEASPSTKIKYYDVTSLYPFINKTGKIPLGHPDIITENFGEIDSYEGLIKCTIVPPRGLHIPVLPYKANNKLLFPLCRTCAEKQQTTQCLHTEHDRAISGTWVLDEIKVALRKGYRIQHIDEIWHFSNVSQYDPETKTGGLFTEYVNTFLKIKQQASGWPKWCTNDTLKEKYINDYYIREGILLDASKIEKNPGLRRLAKLMLNSFWGKFGQRSNLVQNKYISDPLEYFEMLTSDSIEVKNVKFVSMDMVQMDWVYDNEFVQTSDRTNVVIAAYTTAQARLKLFQYLDSLKENTIYCDTDSIVFTVDEGGTDLPIGDYLGELSNEVPEHDIMTFVTGGPKNYAYTMKHKLSGVIHTCCKVRGITLNYKNTQVVNFETIRDMVRGTKKLVSVVDDFKIRRDVKTGHVITMSEKKDYKLIFDKRILCENYETIPYGM